eukprot:4203824-Pleurochrysis_carterae.AAC.1
MIRRQDPPQRSRGGHRLDAMHVDTASDIDGDESAAGSNDMTEDDATLFAMFNASGLPASLKGKILCHNCLGWGPGATLQRTRVASPFAYLLSSPAGQATAST